MEFFNNFKELIDSNKLTPAGIAELHQHLEFDGFDITPDPETDTEPEQGVEIRCFKDNYDVIEYFSPNLFNALKKELAFSCFDDEKYFQELQANDGFFSYVIEELIFIV